MLKLFSINEANNLIPHVSRIIGEMQEAISDVNALRQAIVALDQNSVQARNMAQEIGFLLRSIQSSKAELDRLGVFLRDVDSGWVDIPSQLGAEVVLLSWHQGDGSITRFHRLNTQEIQPLPNLIGDAHSAELNLPQQ
jgi:hypothetical protein